MPQRSPDPLANCPEGAGVMVQELPERVGAGRLAAVGSALAPAALFVAVRLVGLLLLVLVANAQGEEPAGALGSWDAHWFLGIAQGGYSGVPAGLVDAYGRRTAETPLAFFPGYPAMVSVIAFVTGLPMLPAGLVATTLAGILAAGGIARIGELVPGGSRRVGLILVTLFAAAPMSIVFTMAYSEALFCALAAWALVALLRGQWLAAGILSALAGVVRPTAAALVVAIALGAVLARGDAFTNGGWRRWAGTLLAPLGLLGYLGWVALRTGSVTGWFDVQQRGWGSRFDGGQASASFALEALASGRSVMETTTVALLLGALVLLAVCVREALGGRLAWPLVAYAAVVVAMDVGSNGLMGSKARLLVPAFTLLIPVAVGLGRRRPGTAAAVLAAVVLATAWFGAYAVTAWPYAI